LDGDTAGSVELTRDIKEATMPWTRERLERLAEESLKDLRLVVVANREPYVHKRVDLTIRWSRPPGGLVTALDPVMRACGGTWVAQASGNADRETADPKGRLRVPPDNPSYTLRRVWLTTEEESGYYRGFANSALWPLCHIAYTRPNFDTGEWEHYKRVNQRFADVTLEEIEGAPAIVFVQDYHFALLPRLIKQRRPDVVVCQFWHIPWPNSEAFRICPWAEEILDGLLGNDLLAFHVQYHCNNFLDTVERLVEAKVNYENFTVTRGGHATRTAPFPISIDPDVQYTKKSGGDAEARKLAQWFGARDQMLIVGVDRIDYTKGIPERLRALDRLFERHPEHRERIVYLSLATLSRAEVKPYVQINREIGALVRQINKKYRTKLWEPIAFLRDDHSAEEIFAAYRAAHVCVVSSLHDGMNLVAKEFVAARRDLRGVLVLSLFTGAARELTEALLINPYAVDEFAEALHAALTMPVEEQERRMSRLREKIRDNNVYRWAGSLLAEASRLVEVVQ
jgi:trehalose 6-phosphate synthase